MLQPKITGIIILMLLAGVLVIPSSALTLTPGQASSPAIANGDSVYLTGIATGQPQVGLQVWVIGNNYLQVSTISVNPDDSYTFELKPDDTRNLAPGQYYVVIQHPMMNGQFDIIYDAATGNVINRQLGNPPGTTIFKISGSGSLQSSYAASALVRAISSQNVDDTFITSGFTVMTPDALIDPIGDHAVGDRFTISGSTNLAVGDDLSVEVYSSSFLPTSKSQSGEFTGATGMVKVTPGTGANGLNRWSFDIDTSSWRPDVYIVKVSGITIDVTGSSTFNIVEHLPTTRITTAPPTSVPTSPATTAPVVVTNSPTPAQTTPLPKPTQSPVPLPEIIGGLVIVLIIRQTKKKE